MTDLNRELRALIADWRRIQRDDPDIEGPVVRGLYGECADKVEALLLAAVQPEDEGEDEGDADPA